MFDLFYSLDFGIFIISCFGLLCILDTMLTRFMITVMARRCYKKYKKCVICDFNERNHNVGHELTHKVGCWKNGDPNVKWYK